MVAACAKCQEQHSQVVVALLLLLAGVFPSAAARQQLLLQQPARGCCGTLPSLCSWEVLAGLFEPVALPEAHCNSAELASGPSGTSDPQPPWRALPFPVAGSLTSLPTSGIGPEQVSHLPETVVGIQSPFLSLAS